MLFILFQPPELPEEQEEYKDHIPEETYIYRPPISKPWVSLGSEKEIEEEYQVKIDNINIDLY